MKKLFLPIISAIFALALGGCISSKHEEFVHCRDGNFSLTLSLGDLTRAGEGNDSGADIMDEPLNENLVNSLELFFYPDGGEASDAVYATRLELGNDSFVDSETLTNVSIPAAALNQLFGTGNNAKTTCKVYAVANLATGRTTATNGLYANTTLAELHALEIATAEGKRFSDTVNYDLSEYDPNYDEGTLLHAVKPQESFVMDSDLATVTKEQGNKLSGTVNLTRAAAKISFRTFVADAITIDGEKWIPSLETLTVTYNNVVENSLLNNGSENDTDYSFPLPAEVEYANANEIQMMEGDFTADTPDFDGVIEGVDSWSEVVCVTPFYTYPIRWADGAKTEPHLNLTLGWYKEADSAQTMVFYNYTVPINMTDLKLVRNKHYKIALRVGVLGDLDYLEPSEYSYEVLDWVSESVEVELSRPKFLVVDKDYVVMNNIEDIRIGYTASDEVVVSLVSEDFGTTDKTDYSVYPNQTDTPNGNGYYFTNDAANKEIFFHHKLDNERSDTDEIYDYLAHKVVLKVALESDPTIFTNVTIVQYPMLYVETHPGYHQVSGVSPSNNSNWVYVNAVGSPGKNSGESWWSTYGGVMSGAYPRLFNVVVSSLGADASSYYIGDPREPSNTKEFEFYQVSSGNVGNRVATGTDASGDSSLNGYRESISGPESEKVLAPSFIIASACSLYSPNGNGYTNLYAESSGKYRCAAYQEAGYPAGRWRIPTPAELQFMGRLCAEGKIDAIFYNGRVYLSSNGAYSYNDNDGSFTKSSSQANSVRCVYDIWYWNDKCKNIDDFIWGAEGDTAGGVKSEYLVSVENCTY